MKTKNLTIIVFLVITFILPRGVSAEEEIEVKPLCTYEYQIFQALNLFDDPINSIQESEKIGRGQFASIVASLLNIQVAEKPDALSFADVPEDYWCASAIYGLWSYGLMQGYSDTEFKPDQEITYFEALKVIIDALGYGDMIAYRYKDKESGYLIVAQDLKILKDIQYRRDSPILAEEFFKMLYHVCRAEVLEMKMVESDAVIKTGAGNTLLSLYHGIYQGEGIVTANGVTSLTNLAPEANQYVIGERVLLNYGKDYSNLLGYNTDYFYREDGAENILLYVGKKPINNVEITIDADHILFDDPEFRMLNIVYQQDEKAKSIRLSNVVQFLYNGILFPTMDISDYDIGDGQINAIDYNGDGLYDVVKIQEYKSCFVESVSIEQNVIYGKYGVELDLEQYKFLKIYDEQGVVSGVEQIRKGQIVSYLESKDKEILVLYISGQTVEGKVKEIIREEDAAKTTYVIDEEEYCLSHELVERIQTGKTDISFPQINKKYLFYISFDGKIAEFTMDENSNYAFLVGIDDDTFHSEVQMKFIMADGKSIVASLNKKVRHNNQEYDKGDLLKQADFYDTEGHLKRQIVELHLNDLGYISELNLPQRTTNEFGYDFENFSLDYVSESALYKGSEQNCFEGNYSISKTSIIFMIPEGEDYDEEDIEVIQPKALMDGRYYHVELYDCDPTLVAKAAVIRGSAALSYERGLLVVDEVTNVLNSDGEAVQQVTGVMLGQNVKYIEKEAGIFPKDLKRGDVCRISTDTINNYLVTAMQRFTSLKDHPAPFINNVEGTSTINSDWSNVFGYLYAKSDTAISTIDPDKNSGEGKVMAHSLNGAVAQVTVYDARKNTVRPGTQSDIVPKVLPNADGSIDITKDSPMVFVYRRQDYAREIIYVLY